MALRILVDIALFLATFFFPWWVGVILVILAMMCIDFFVEIIFVGAVFDILYGAPLPVLANFSYVFTLGGVIVFAIFSAFKRRMVFYPSKFI